MENLEQNNIPKEELLVDVQPVIEQELVIEQQEEISDNAYWD